MSHYSPKQADAVLEACARAAHEATLAVERTHGVPLYPWEQLPPIEREKLKHSAAVALDELASADVAGGTPEAADKAVEIFGARVRLEPARANLFLSVVAAVKTTLDQEVAEE
jgi:hypothetical protein